MNKKKVDKYDKLVDNRVKFYEDAKVLAIKSNLSPFDIIAVFESLKEVFLVSMRDIADANTLYEENKESKDKDKSMRNYFG